MGLHGDQRGEGGRDMVTRGGKEGATWRPEEGRRGKHGDQREEGRRGQHGDQRREGGDNMVTRGGKEATTC